MGRRCRWSWALGVPFWSMKGRTFSWVGSGHFDWFCVEMKNVKCRFVPMPLDMFMELRHRQTHSCQAASWATNKNLFIHLRTAGITQISLKKVDERISHFTKCDHRRCTTDIEASAVWDYWANMKLDRGLGAKIRISLTRLFFSSRLHESRYLSTRQYVRIVHQWMEMIGLKGSVCATHTMRCTKS